MTSIVALALFLSVYIVLAVAGKAVVGFVELVKHTFR